MPKPTHVLLVDLNQTLEFQRKILMEKREQLDTQLQEIDKAIGAIIEAQERLNK